MDILENLKSEFNHHVSFREKRPGIVQVLAPLFHEDGDMVDIFLDLPKSLGETIRISDHGMTLMRLSYSYDIDTPTKQRILGRILSENGIEEDRGRLYLNTSKEGLYPSLLQFAQTVAKVSNMQAFRREVMQNLFYEMLGDFVRSTLSRFQPVEHYLPLPHRDDLEVDWKLNLSREMFLFGEPLAKFPIASRGSAISGALVLLRGFAGRCGLPQVVFPQGEEVAPRFRPRRDVALSARAKYFGDLCRQWAK